MTRIPTQNIDTWLRRHCKVLQETQQKIGDKGYRSSEYCAIIQLERNEAIGGYRHVPNFFFRGADMGVTRYSGQPPACYTCGDCNLKCSSCMADLCSRCGTLGHRTATCRKPITCSLFGEEGHDYRMCSLAFLNQQHPEEYHFYLVRAQEEAAHQECVREERRCQAEEQQRAKRRRERGSGGRPSAREQNWKRKNKSWR